MTGVQTCALPILKTALIIPGEGEVRPHSIGTRMMTNYLNPSMYLFWFTVGAPFLVRSSRTDFSPGIVFTLSDRKRVV